PFNIYYVGTRTLSSPLAGHVSAGLLLVSLASRSERLRPLPSTPRPVLWPVRSDPQSSVFQLSQVAFGRIRRPARQPTAATYQPVQNRARNSAPSNRPCRGGTEHLASPGPRKAGAIAVPLRCLSGAANTWHPEKIARRRFLGRRLL